MSINPYKMKKAELVKFLTGRCRHHHKYCEHPNCFIEEQEMEPKIGFLDIETSGFQGNFHIMLSYAIKEAGKNGKTYARTITKKELRSKTFDKKLTEDLMKDLLKFDKVVTYYGTGFDIPFMRTRALKWGIEFPLYGYVKHQDCYYMAKSKLKLHRYSLDAVTRHLGIEGKNHVLGDEWLKAYMHGDKKALAYILEHNILDVEILEKVYDTLVDFMGVSNKSI